MDRRLGIAALLVIGVAAGLLLAGQMRRDCSFSDAAWAEARRLPGYSDARFEALRPMTARLVKCEELLKGRSRSAVRAILGPPDDEASTQREWFYEIGVPDPRSDYSPLAVQFGRDGLADQARVPGFIEP
jgi:hypothetical protein